MGMKSASQSAAWCPDYVWQGVHKSPATSCSHQLSSFCRTHIRRMFHSSCQTSRGLLFHSALDCSFFFLARCLSGSSLTPSGSKSIYFLCFKKQKSPTPNIWFKTTPITVTIALLAMHFKIIKPPVIIKCYY